MLFTLEFEIEKAQKSKSSVDSNRFPMYIRGYFLFVLFLCTSCPYGYTYFFALPLAAEMLF